MFQIQLVTAYVIIYIGVQFRAKIIELLLESQKRNEDLIDTAIQVAHDLRSPLFALNVATSGLDNIDSDKKDMLNLSHERIKNISVELLLKFKKNSKNMGANNFVLKPLELKIYNIMPLVEKIVQEKNATLRNGSKILVIGDFEAKAKLDISNLFRVISNLIDNSLESSDKSIIVQLKVVQANMGCKIVISDNGPGIPKSILGKLFSRGFTFGKANGTGLGLYHAKKIIEGWGGELCISTQDKIGTTITIILKA